MKIILLQDVKGVGKIHEVKDVSAGYANNALIPQGKARLATPAAIKELESRQAKKSESHIQELTKLEEKLSDLDEVRIEADANEQGHLFASIGAKDLGERIGVAEDLILIKTPVKELGEHEVFIKVGDKEKKLKVSVIGRS